MLLRMVLNVLVLFFPVVLAIHNLDEYSRYEEFVRIYHTRLPIRLTARRTIFWAAATLTAAAIFICVGAVVSKSQVLLLISKASICALMLNAVSHCLLSLKRGRWLPGTRSACILVLPYSVIALIVMGTSGGDSPVSMLRYALLGAVTIPLAVVGSLLVGSGIARLRGPGRSRERTMSGE